MNKLDVMSLVRDIANDAILQYINTGSVTSVHEIRLEDAESDVHSRLSSIVAFVLSALSIECTVETKHDKYGKCYAELTCTLLTTGTATANADVATLLIKLHKFT